MRIHSIIHAEFEKPGMIESWAKKNNHQFSNTHIYNHEILPTVADFDFLIVMGGPQSPTRLDRWPYLQAEIDLIKQTMAANKPILGICLGAQLLAESLGAKTERSPHKEIGLFPIALLPEAAADPVFSQFPAEFSVMHWHNDMPGLPQSARLLAKSQGCPRQAFSVGDRFYGIQCHLEMTAENIKDMLQHCENDLKPDLYIQSKQDLIQHDLSEVNQKMKVLLEYLSCKHENN